MRLNNINGAKFDWNDLTLVPAVLSDIDSRSQVNARLENGKLPIFVAPMDTVIDSNNAKGFLDAGLNLTLPRNVKYGDEGTTDEMFFSYGLDELIQMEENGDKLPKRVLIDIANGHMKKLYDFSKQLKEKYGDDLILMVGNIANPETYRMFCGIGVDLIRVGIGNGCFTPNTLVRTENGDKKIRDIKVGDKVFTHKNRLQEVQQLHTYHKTESLLRINDIECTKNHEFLVVNRNDANVVTETNYLDYAYWVPAEGLDKNIHLLIEL